MIGLLRLVPGGGGLIRLMALDVAGLLSALSTHQMGVMPVAIRLPVDTQCRLQSSPQLVAGLTTNTAQFMTQIDAQFIAVGHPQLSLSWGSVSPTTLASNTARYSAVVSGFRHSLKHSFCTPDWEATPASIG